jgi:hypothetical protein
MEQVEICHKYGAHPIRVKLEKNSKGYNYEISIAGSDIDEILAQVQEADQKIKAEYCQAEA